jgi:hypothetical protein
MRHHPINTFSIIAAHASLYPPVLQKRVISAACMHLFWARIALSVCPQLKLQGQHGQGDVRAVSRPTRAVSIKGFENTDGILMR